MKVLDHIFQILAFSDHRTFQSLHQHLAALAGAVGMSVQRVSHPLDSRSETGRQVGMFGCSGAESLLQYARIHQRSSNSGCTGTGHRP